MVYIDYARLLSLHYVCPFRAADGYERGGQDRTLMRKKVAYSKLAAFFVASS